MSKCLDNCLYNKVKLLHLISKTIWFIEKHACNDAQQAQQHEFDAMLKQLATDLEPYLHKLKEDLCSSSCN